ncbi:MAG: group II intron reverse transcriptase/maturase [Chloroflexi bacterium]|nr:group II intron reverse transcriptase/maturase [Chloroflexota bacterium]
MSTKLAELAARAKKVARLTNVVQYVDEELLLLAFRSLRKRAAPGVDGQSYEDYEAKLGQNLRDLYDRLRSGRYQAPPIRRVYIPKASGGQRPLGITTIEDRVVQKAVAWVLSAVYEQDFLECSHGFRPGRSPHTALHQLRDGTMQHWGRYVVEVDLRGYFDHVNHEWLRKFLRHRVNDGGLLRLIGKWLKAGVLENGVVTRSTDGTPQGGPVSPVLANSYLHYALDLWFERRFKKGCRGYAGLTRFADDFVAVFRERGDAERFRREVEERVAAFGLQVAPEKTAVRLFDGNLLKGSRGLVVKPASFTFLGFTHFLAKTRTGQVQVGRKPSVKARERFLRRIAEWLKANKHQRVRVHQAYLAKALNGYYQYFGLRLCWRALYSVHRRVRRLWQQTLRRRSDKARRTCDWPTLDAKPWFQLPRPHLTQTWV